MSDTIKKKKKVEVEEDGLLDGGPTIKNWILAYEEIPFAEAPERLSEGI